MLVCVCVGGISAGSRNNYSAYGYTPHRSVEEKKNSNRGQGFAKKPTYYSDL